tara:strand:+ start:828 stop:1235 length:408 start_codon:yes stop_codon:yes gene_type:complete
MEILKTNMIEKFNNNIDYEKSKFMTNLDDKLENQYNLLKSFLSSIDKNNDGVYRFETNSIEHNEDAKLFYNENLELIIKNYPYKNYYNLKNSKKKITQTLKLMCKSLNIPLNKKVKLIYRNSNDKTTKGIYEIKI